MTGSGTATLTCFRLGRILSTKEVYCCGAENGRSANWPHQARFCEGCGEVWEREVYTYHFDYAGRGAPWNVRSSLCPSCDEQVTRREFAEIMKEYENAS